MNVSFTFIYYIIIFPNSFDKSSIEKKIHPREKVDFREL